MVRVRVRAREMRFASIHCASRGASNVCARVCLGAVVITQKVTSGWNAANASATLVQREAVSTSCVYNELSTDLAFSTDDSDGARANCLPMRWNRDFTYGN